MRAGKGFTIVELLIVTVVIAILATIITITYNGIVNRAYLAKASAAVDTYVKILEMYRIEYGRYPTYTSATTNICLARTGSLPAASPLALNQCNNDSVDGAYINSDFNTALTTFFGQLPDTSLPATQYKGTSYSRGLAYFATSNGQYAEIYYSLKGDSQCPRGTRVTSGGTFSCILYLGT